MDVTDGLWKNIYELVENFLIAKTKAESSQDIVEAIDRLERRSDTCYTGLDLLDRQWNYAAWLSLTECVRRIEASLTPNEYGSSKHKILVMNLARVAGQLWKFAHDHGRPKQCAPSVFRWFPRVAQESALAFEVPGRILYSACIFRPGIGVFTPLR